jgi:hypothetical protein
MDKKCRHGKAREIWRGEEQLNHAAQRNYKHTMKKCI